MVWQSASLSLFGEYISRIILFNDLHLTSSIILQPSRILYLAFVILWFLYDSFYSLYLHLKSKYLSQSIEFWVTLHNTDVSFNIRSSVKFIDKPLIFIWKQIKLLKRRITMKIIQQSWIKCFKLQLKHRLIIHIGPRCLTIKLTIYRYYSETLSWRQNGIYFHYQHQDIWKSKLETCGSISRYFRSMHQNIPDP